MYNYFYIVMAKINYKRCAYIVQEINYQYSRQNHCFSYFLLIKYENEPCFNAAFSKELNFEILQLCPDIVHV